MSRIPPGGAVRVRRTSHPRAEEAEKAEERAADLEALLEDLGPQLTRGGPAQQAPKQALNQALKQARQQVHRAQDTLERPARLPVGLPCVDRLLGGGFPLGGLSEVSGTVASLGSSGRTASASSGKTASASSGKTTLALSLLRATTGRGELAAWVDGADAFDPASAERLGVDLDRVLWVRVRGWQAASRASERLLRTEGFPLVVLDWTASRETPGSVSWIRLARLATATRTALVLLSASRLAGPHAELALEMQPARPRFCGAPALLEGLETRMVVARNRAAPVDPGASFAVELQAPSEAVPTGTPPPRESAA